MNRKEPQLRSSQDGHSHVRVAGVFIGGIVAVGAGFLIAPEQLLDGSSRVLAAALFGGVGGGVGGVVA